jgi:GxxExxY protein
MPIHPSHPITAISQAEFHQIHRRMLGHAFAIHNQFGRLLDESIYKLELAARCEADGMTAQREVGLRVAHGGFVKDYFIDLLLCGSTIVEAKTTKELIAAHHGQGINYLLLAGTHHGSLVNFRPSRVEARFLSTRLSHDLRRRYEISADSWPSDNTHRWLRECLHAFCSDVGLGLDLPLYREALACLAPCPQQLVPIVSGSKKIGHHEMLMASPNTALAISALEDLADYRHHLQRLLASTELKAISWINFQLGHIQLQQIQQLGQP